ncbi:MAG: hypothetical protein WCK91_03405 [bacterium]
MYPRVVIEALGILYKEYNRAFSGLADRNREHDADYQHCGGGGINHMVQIDMVGLDDEFLGWAIHQSLDELLRVLRSKIFEIENSLAAYQIIQNIGISGTSDSFSFKNRFRTALDGIRRKFGKPISLLAVTDEKYEGMLGYEFGHPSGSHIPDSEVVESSGFDTFWGPKQFLEHLEANGGQCKNLLYVRSSDPIPKLRNPKLQVDHPLLGDANLRRIIKANTLTMNVDAPDMHYDERINDTKEYLPMMRIAHRIDNVESLQALSAGSDIVWRLKPMKCAYGCYGHLRGTLYDKHFIKDLRKGLELRGAYVAQPELEIPEIVDSSSADSYRFIDRNFLSIDGDQITFLGGIRNLMPSDSTEAREGRIHGNRDMVSVEFCYL